MAILTTTAFANALKILYPQGLDELWFKKCPFLAAVKHSYDFEGASKQIRQLYAPQNGSNTFATALANKSTPAISDFTVTRVKTYVLGSIDNEALMASRSNKGAQAKAVDTSVKAAMYEFGRAAAHQVWGNSGGARGRGAAASGFGTPTCTLADARDAVKFEVGMSVQLSSDDGTGGAGVRAGTVTITGIDRQAGTLTAAANWTASIPAAANQDYLFREGDYASCLSGVLDWVPIAAPTAGDNQFGVDRSVDVDRLAGVRVVAAAGNPIEECIFEGAGELEVRGQEPDLVVLHPMRMAELRKNMHSKAWMQVPVKTNSPKVSFNGLSFPGPMGDIVVMSDHMCPYDYALMTEKASWELACLGKAPHFSEEDGLKFSREASSDAIEFRLKAYWQLLNHNPGASALITL